MHKLFCPIISYTEYIQTVLSFITNNYAPCPFTAVVVFCRRHEKNFLGSDIDRFVLSSSSVPRGKRRAHTSIAPHRIDYWSYSRLVIVALLVSRPGGRVRSKQS